MSSETDPFAFGAPVPPPVDDRPVNPVEVEQALRRLVNEIATSVRTVSDTLDNYRKAEREYDLAFARAYNRHGGAAHAKKYVAEELTQDERAARDNAEVVWRYASTRARSLETELTAWQSIAKSVNGMYGAAGG